MDREREIARLGLAFDRNWKLASKNKIVISMSYLNTGVLLDNRQIDRLFGSLVILSLLSSTFLCPPQPSADQEAREDRAHHIVELVPHKKPQ